MAHRIFCVMVYVVSITIMWGCGTQNIQPAPTSDSQLGDSRALDHIHAVRRFDAEQERRREVQAMLDESLSAPLMEERAAAALLASDRATGDVAKSVSAIDSAIDVVVQNLQNADTIGFKESSARVSEGSLQISLDMSQGAMEATGNPLDVAISGDGFFAVKMPIQNQIGYTRCGSFVVNGIGGLIASIGDGCQLVPPITLPTNATNVSIGTDGTVQYVKAGSTVKSTAGQIKLVRFPNPHDLSLFHQGVYMETPGSGPAITTVPGENATGLLLSGFLENSNVEIFRERVRLRFLTEWRSALSRALEQRKN